MALISVIVPVYNVYDYMDRCIRSVLSQTFKDFEIILVAGDSSDGSTEKCILWENRDKRIRLIKQAKGRLGSARNLGIREANASVIAFLDADDWWDFSMLEKMYAEMIRTNADMVMCDRFNVYYHEDGSFDKKEYLQELAMQDSADSVIENPNLIRNIEVSVNGKLYKKKLFVDYQIWQPDIFGEDRAVIHFLISKCKKIGKVREALYYYHFARNGNSVGMAETYATTAECMWYIYNFFLHDCTEGKYRYQLNWIFKTIAELGEEGLKNPCKTHDFRKEGAIKKIYEFLEWYGFDRYGRRVIWGSYNLRRMAWLAFPQLKEKRIHYCYSSIVSLMSPAITAEPFCETEKEERKNWCKADFNKSFRQNLHLLKSDILLIDFLEERFPIMPYRDSCFTLSPVTDEGVCIEEVCERDKRLDIENREELWKRSCIAFINYLGKYIDSRQIILVKMKLAEQYGDYAEKRYFENIAEIRKINKILDEYYTFFEKHFSGIKVMDCCHGAYFYTDKDFKFGCVPWHLNENFYVYHAQQIERLFTD